MADEGELVQMDEDQKVVGDADNANNPVPNDINLKEIISTLDTWSRTCNSVLDMLGDQITKVNMGGLSKP